MIDALIESKLERVQILCKKYDIKEMYFFGSSVNGKYTKGKSDLDIFIDTSEENMKNIVRFKIEMYQLFECDIDVFHKKWYKHKELEMYIQAHKVLIYRKLE